MEILAIRLCKVSWESLWVDFNVEQLKYRSVPSLKEHVDRTIEKETECHEYKQRSSFLQPHIIRN